MSPSSVSPATISVTARERSTAVLVAGSGLSSCASTSRGVSLEVVSPEGIFRIIPAPKTRAMAEEILRRLRRPQSLAVLATYQRSAPLPAQVRILGLDPGSQRTGYAVVQCDGGGVKYVV